MNSKFVKTAKKHMQVNKGTNNLSFASQGKLAMFGAYGEVLAMSHIQQLGYNVRYTGHDSVGYDLLVENALKVEVKTARKSKDGIWQASLTKLGHSDVTKSDVVLFQCVVECGKVVTFAIPTSVIAHLKQIKITSHPLSYSGKFAQYRLI